MSVAEATAAVKSLQPPVNHYRTFDIRLKESPRSGRIIFRTKGLEIGYPGTPLFKADDIELNRPGMCGSNWAKRNRQDNLFANLAGQIGPIGR